MKPLSPHQRWVLARLAEGARISHHGALYFPDDVPARLSAPTTVKGVTMERLKRTGVVKWVAHPKMRSAGWYEISERGRAWAEVAS